MGQIRERILSSFVSLLLDIGKFVEHLWNVCGTFVEHYYSIYCTSGQMQAGDTFGKKDMIKIIRSGIEKE